MRIKIYKGKKTLFEGEAWVNPEFYTVTANDKRYEFPSREEFYKFLRGMSAKVSYWDGENEHTYKVRVTPITNQAVPNPCDVVREIRDVIENDENRYYDLLEIKYQKRTLHIPIPILRDKLKEAGICAMDVIETLERVLPLKIRDDQFFECGFFQCDEEDEEAEREAENFNKETAKEQFLRCFINAIQNNQSMSADYEIVAYVKAYM